VAEEIDWATIDDWTRRTLAGELRWHRTANGYGADGGFPRLRKDGDDVTLETAGADGEAESDFSDRRQALLELWDAVAAADKDTNASTRLM
jgi:hypothetical protein